MKQIATFSRVDEANMLRLHLEGSGIPAFVRDGETVAADWALSNAIGGVKVDVRDEDVERALEILRAFEPSPAGTPSKAVPTRHSISRYVKMAGVLFVIILGLIALTVGFRSRDVPPEMLVISAAGIAAAIAAFCALFDW